ncbi:MAG: manganese efflux pump MntP family protein [Phycisphaerae bacterium]
MSGYIEVIALAFALAMDAFSVSLATGAVYRKVHLRYSLLMAGMFGLFQAVMPLIGWAIGYACSEFLAPVARLVAFVLLVIVGGKMIYESFKLSSTGESEDVKVNLLTVLVLAAATSIDALAAGFTLTLMETNPWLDVAIIGAVTFILCVIGSEIGAKCGHLFEGKTELLGGIVLLLIGLKILIFG